MILLNSIEEIDNFLKNNLSEYRYNHSLLVAKEASSLAQYYNLDYNKAYLAGLVHDIAKEFTDEENNYYINKYKIDGDLLNDNLKPALHGYIGALFLKEKYNMDDEICDSVRYHTLGSVNMTLFDKIILVSDKLGRENQDKELKLLAFENIDKAVVYILEKQQIKLEAKGMTLYKDTKKLLNKLKCMI